MTAMEFEGRTEREAVAKAAAELGSESFDVEILEKSGGDIRTKQGENPSSDSG
jgi:predicted RNA-binding protein Jag